MKDSKTNHIKEALKRYTLFSYIALTLLGLYSAAMFYAGMQYESGHTAEAAQVHVIKVVSPK
jgi:hypothetical protein